jgi:fructose-1,6-bisphosphatase/inositol monophosphatase family enzyme
MSDRAELEILRQLLCRLGDAIRDSVVAARAASTTDELASVAEVTAADTIYRIDKISEEAIVAWFSSTWPASMPVEVVMEGLEGHGPLTFPPGTRVEATRWKVIIDPIDGTRCIMYDKRPAWALAAVAPQRGDATHLGDIVAAAMTELPTTKQWRADQVSAVHGGGRDGVVAEAVRVLTAARTQVALRPSQARDLHHGFASVVKFFPDGKEATARVEEALWRELAGAGSVVNPLVFDDQYPSTGGQIYELVSGRDRVTADLRPLIYPKVGVPLALTCHPYDICTALILNEAGGVVERPDGGPLCAPLDTTTPVAWVGYANVTLAELVRPHLQRILREQGYL